MFTSEPSLAQRIERMIGDVAIIDTRSELSSNQPHIPDLAALISAFPVRLALRGVGMPAGVLGEGRPIDEQVRDVLPYLHQIRNTSAAWCLFRICRDLYDFDEPHLTLANYGGLLDRVAQGASEPDRAAQIIQDRARIRLVVASLPANDPATEEVVAAPAFMTHRFEIVATDHSDATSEEIRQGVFAQLDRVIEATVKFAGFSEPPQLDNPIHAAVLAWHHMHEAPLQVVLDRNGSGATTSFEAILAAVQRYPRARFALLTGSPELGPKVAGLAGSYPNVFAEGNAGTGAWPSAIERNVLSRVEQASATKIGGFSSGATSAEWVYGSLQLTKKATASALAQAVAAGFFEEDEIPPVLQSTFATAPATWYGLDVEVP